MKLRPRKIVPTPPEDYEWVLGLGWGSVALSLFSSLFIFPEDSDSLLALAWGPFFGLAIVLFLTAAGGMLAHSQRTNSLPLPRGSKVVLGVSAAFIVILLLKILNDAGRHHSPGGF